MSLPSGSWMDSRKRNRRDTGTVHAMATGMAKEPLWLRAVSGGVVAAGRREGQRCCQWCL